jgi:hypothetical protein
MNPALLERVISAVEPHVLSRCCGLEFEMAYQARVAADRIRFALKQVEQLNPTSAVAREAAFQLLEALDRLETADRNFQMRWRRAYDCEGKRDRSSATVSPNNGSRTNS